MLAMQWYGDDMAQMVRPHRSQKYSYIETIHKMYKMSSIYIQCTTIDSGGIYEEPWNTEKTMEKFLSGMRMEHENADSYSTMPCMQRQSTSDSAVLPSSRPVSLSQQGKLCLRSGFSPPGWKGKKHHLKYQ